MYPDTAREAVSIFFLCHQNVCFLINMNTIEIFDTQMMTEESGVFFAPTYSR